MTITNKVFVAGHNGLVGSAVCRRLSRDGVKATTVDRSELDLMDQRLVESWFTAEKPEQVYLAAAKVGGIKANNDYPAEFLRDNLVMQTNVIHAAYKAGVKKLLFLGSS
ncbi:MAG: NAD-dependent epimerase/dehydratase family protein, partial [Woeseiaceae bacterium]